MLFSTVKEGVLLPRAVSFPIFRCLSNAHIRVILWHGFFWINYSNTSRSRSFWISISLLNSNVIVIVVLDSWSTPGIFPIRAQPNNKWIATNPQFNMCFLSVNNLPATSAPIKCSIGPCPLVHDKWRWSFSASGVHSSEEIEETSLQMTSLTPQIGNDNLHWG